MRFSAHAFSLHMVSGQPLTTKTDCITVLNIIALQVHYYKDTTNTVSKDLGMRNSYGIWKQEHTQPFHFTWLQIYLFGNFLLYYPLYPISFSTILYFFYKKNKFSR